jgi:hypothetical protein
VIVTLFLLCAVAQFFFVGLIAFGYESGGLWHQTLGDAMVPFALVIAIVSAFAGRRIAILGLILFLLMVLQYVLAKFAPGLSPWVAALHPVNGLAILGVAGGGIQRALAELKEEAPAVPAA